MENQLNHEAKHNLIDFQYSLTNYIVAIETLMKAVEQKEKSTFHPSLTSSKLILVEILDQTLQFKKRKLQLMTQVQDSSTIPAAKTPNSQKWKIVKPWVIPIPPYK